MAGACDRVVARQRHGGRQVCRVDTTSQYLIWFRNFTEVPRPLRAGVRQTIINAFSQIRQLVFDFDRRLSPRDLRVRHSSEIPQWGAWGESSRMSINDQLEDGEATIYVGMMRAMRLAQADGGCRLAFDNTDESLGSMIANTTVHEIGHLLGMMSGGSDDAGHSTDPNNYMHEFPRRSGQQRQTTRMFSGVLEHTVQRGDTLWGILSRFKRGRLHSCIRGPDNLTVGQVWETPRNREQGYVAHPTKSGVPGRRANDPNYIYPGERVAFSHNTFRTDAYRQSFPAWLGQKTFTEAQVQQMNAWVRDRIRTLQNRRTTQ